MTWQLASQELPEGGVPLVVHELNKQLVCSWAWRKLTKTSRVALEARVRSSVDAPPRTAAALRRHGLLDDTGTPTDVAVELIEYAQFMRGHGYWRAS